jgi:hypothetical protein
VVQAPLAATSSRGGTSSEGFPSRGLEDMVALALEAAALSAIRQHGQGHPHHTPIHAAMGRDGTVYPDLFGGRVLVAVPPLTVSSSAPHGGSYFHHGFKPNADQNTSPQPHVHPNQRVNHAEEAYYEGGKRVHYQQQQQQSSHSQDRGDPIDEGKGKAYFEGGRRVDNPQVSPRAQQPQHPRPQHPHGSYYHHSTSTSKEAPERVSEPKPPPVAWTVDMDVSQSGSRSHSNGRAPAPALAPAQAAADTFSRLQQGGPSVPPLATGTAAARGSDGEADSEGSQSTRRKRAQWSMPADRSANHGAADGGTNKLPLSARGNPQPSPRIVSARVGDDDNGTVFSASSLATGVGTVSSKAPRPLSEATTTRRNPPEQGERRDRSGGGGGYQPMPWSAVPAGADIDVHPLCIHRDSTPLRCVAVCNPVENLDDSLAESGGRGGVEASITVAIGSNTKTLTVLSMSRPSNSCHIVTDLKDVHRGSVYACDWTKDGNMLASGSNDKMIRISRYVGTDCSEGWLVSNSALCGQFISGRWIRSVFHPEGPQRHHSSSQVQ